MRLMEKSLKEEAARGARERTALHRPDKQSAAKKRLLTGATMKAKY